MYLKITRVSVGQVGVLPGSVKMVTSANLTAITTAGFLNNFGNQLSTIDLSPSDLIECLYDYSELTGSGTFGEFTVSISNGVITLVGLTVFASVAGNVPIFDDTSGGLTDSGASLSNDTSTKIVTLDQTTNPSVPNYIACFSDITGTVSAGADPAINPKRLQLGLSTGVNQGSVLMYPSLATSGSLLIEPSNNTNNADITISNDSHAQDTYYRFADVGTATGSFLNCTLEVADVASNLICKTVTIAASDLIDLGQVVIIPPSVDKQYRILDMLLSTPTVNFVGGSGDRTLGILSDTKTYTIIPSATLETLTTNQRWGSSDIPFPVSIPIHTLTDPGEHLVAQYVGGTNDYLAGVLVLSVFYQRVV